MQTLSPVTRRPWSFICLFVERTLGDLLLNVPATPSCVDPDRAPAVVTAVLLMAGERMPDTIDSAFFYGRSQVRGLGEREGRERIDT